MQDRIDKHILEKKMILNIEEPKDLTKIVKEKETYLIDCVSMWLLIIFKKENYLKNQLQEFVK